MNFKDFFTYMPPTEYNFDILEKDNISQNDLNNDNNQKTNIFPSLDVNLEYVKSKYNTLINSDILIREFTINARNKQYKAFLLYIDGMVDSELMNNFVIKPLMMRNKNNLYNGDQSKVIAEAVTNNITVRKVKKFDMVEYLFNCLIPQNTVDAAYMVNDDIG